MIPGRLYIVEDEALIAMELQDRLRALGYEIVGTAGRGEVATREIAAGSVDLVLMDVNLAGGMSGIEVAGCLRHDLQVGVIFLTAFSDAELLDRARQVEPYGYLVKPYEERELHATIQVALFKREAETERRRLNEERRALERRLLQAQKTESLGRMAGAIAHGLNNTLAVIVGEIEMASARVHDPERALASIGRARAATLRAIDLSQKVRQYVEQPRAGGDVFDLGSVCRDTLAQLRAAVPGHVRFSAEIPPAGPLVYARADLIREALERLITNAGEAVDDRTGGDVVLWVHEADGKQVTGWRTYPAEWEPAGGTYASLAVRDTGSGMTNEVLDRLFDPFFSTKLLGRGLGLALVLSAARSLGGAVAVETALGRGSTFRLLVPIAQAASAAASS
jgi:signal transduction histidine kinase